MGQAGHCPPTAGPPADSQGPMLPLPPPCRVSLPSALLGCSSSGTLQHSLTLRIIGSHCWLCSAVCPALGVWSVMQTDCAKTEDVLLQAGHCVRSCHGLPSATSESHACKLVAVIKSAAARAVYSHSCIKHGHSLCHIATVPPPPPCPSPPKACCTATTHGLLPDH